MPDYSLEDVFSGKPGHVLRPAEDVRRRLRSLAEQLESEMAASGGENAILSRCTLLRLLVEIGRAMQKTGSELPEPVVPRDGKILDILRYLEANLAEDISIDDLAAQFFISKYHMMRRFREETGASTAARPNANIFLIMFHLLSIHITFFSFADLCLYSLSLLFLTVQHRLHWQPNSRLYLFILIQVLLSQILFLLYGRNSEPGSHCP